ncbi:beta-phosphoglucomutase [Lutibacter profundi]|uniref:Beta-phosphoglucomutase n=1 Tax=Lutibacter profundi TaxID=1622118 RepID=A0A120IEA2_9FLAO|nr:beta-phosphoglucomutase [Lutibacter profundi]AMC11051.1 beta-phosphoglucomutase [Lutibacter profundi]
MIKGIIFDLDGVITDTAEFHYLSWKQLSNEERLNFDKLLNEKLKGVSRAKSLDRILKHNNTTFSKTKQKDCLERKNNYYLQYLKKITQKDYLPRIKKFLQELQASNIKIGLGSASKNALSVLERLEATPFFNVIGDGNSVKKAKPAPDLFLYVAKELGLTPNECIVIEDASSGIEAAHKAGMKAIGIGSKEVLGKAEVVLESTNFLKLEIIQNI